MDSFSSADLKIDAPAHPGGGGTVTIPDAHLLFSGDYSRSGADLIVSDQLHRVVVPNYFHGDKRPALVSPNGAPLDPSVIEALTGHVQYAQAASTAAAAAAKVVGHVVKMTGSASVVRNGVTITLNNGDNVLQNDVVQTGSDSTLGLVMIDGTTFNLNAGARLMLNDLTYDASSTSNSSLFTLVQGAASFVAGQVAKTGDMKVGTPVATMGIRGTAVILDISAVDGRVSISVVDQRDGQVHAVEVYNTRGILIGTVTSNGSTLTLTPVANFEVIAQESNKTAAQIAQEFNAFSALLQTYDFGKRLFPDLPQHTDNANPQTPTRFAQGSTPATPVDTSVTTFILPNGNTPAGQGVTPNIVLVDINPTGPAPAGSSTLPADPILIPVNVPATPLPFVVTLPTVSRISGEGGDHFGPVMSADGQYIVYDPDGSIFLYDQKTRTTITIAEAGGGFTYGGQTISADGRYIVFQGSDGTQSYVFIYNNDPSDAHYQDRIQLVAGGAPAISGDGSRIVVEHGGNSIGIYDPQGHVIAIITPAAIGETGAVWLPAISADGHLVAFWNTDASTPGGSGHLFVYDLSTGTSTGIASTATDAGTSAASFSADGRYVVYQSDAPGGHSEIYLYDLSTGQVVFHTANASGASYNPVISPDGHFIIFASDARLTPGDDNSVTDTYVVDVSDPANPVYRQVSNLANGNQPDAVANLGATISAGGLYIAFASSGAPGTGDIFLADPTSGRSAIIQERANSPAVLTASGVIALTGDHNGATLGVVNPNGRFTASFNADGDIVWSFSEPKSDFAALLPGQRVAQDFVILLTNASGTTQIPVRVVVYDADLPVTAAVTNPGTIAGDNGNNTLTGTVNNDILQGFGGNDTIIGLTGVDRAVYTDATGGITVNMATGSVTGQGVGADTLIGIEAVQGSNFVDHYIAAGFAGVSGLPGVPIGFNSFEGMAGDDIIAGNVNAQGQVLTRISYASASAAVTVDFAAGTATGNASVGSDHFTNVNAVIGSGFGDTLRGSDNPNGTYEQYEGRGGNDTIDGRGGYDFATYNNDPATHSGITVNLAAGTVVGDASVGTDTLRRVEAVRGTHFADIYNAIGFNGGSTNAGSLGTFNTFDGQDGNDTIYGNSNTRIQYSNSTAAVLVDLANTGAGGTGVAMDRADASNNTSLDLASVGIDTIHGGVNAVMGSMFGDSLLGSANNENFQGLGGNDFIDGRGGFDIAQFNNMTYTTGGISVDFAAGIVTGNASNGTDTLRSIEGVQGTNFNDSFDASGFGITGLNVGNNGTFNQFEGMAGIDHIIGNGNTRVVYFNAAAGVTVDIQDGTADGDASVGHDDFTGVSGVGGSNFADTLRGSNNAQGTIEQFEGRGGDDTLDGRGGFDQAIYSNDPNVTTRITVNMFAGTVNGDAAVGHDTLISIESVIGSRFGDIYDAVNFVGFNEFQGLGGDDQISGNGSTQLGYYSATSGVTVDMKPGTADGDASVGHDTFSGVNQIRGSNFGDTFHGNDDNNILDGLGGNDLLDGRGGEDLLIGGSGADTFVYADGYGADTVADFNRGEGDRIDLSGVSGIYSLADVLEIAVTEGGNTLIDLGEAGMLELIGVSTLVESDFIFATAPNGAPAVSFAPTYLHFDGSTAAIGPVATTHVGNGAEDGVTLAGWVNWDGQGDGEDAQLLFYNGSTSDAGFGVNGFVTAEGLALRIFAGGIGGFDTGVTLTAGQWHNVALSHVDGIFTLFVDGVAEFTVEHDVNGIPGLYDYPDFTSIGGVTVSIEGQESLAEGFHGSIADVSVWDIALTGDQVQATLFTSLSGNESGLAGYFPLNDGSGATATDLVNSAGNLTLLGNPGWIANSSDNWLANGATIDEDGSLRLTSLSVSDADAASAPITVTLSVQHGTLAFDDADVAGLTGDLDGSDGTVSLTGSQSAINAALANGVVYTPGSNYNGSDTLTVTANDQGHNGPGGAQSAVLQFGINVTAVNDAPVFTGDDLAASYTGTAAVAIADNVLASDIDSANYDGGSLTATVTAGFQVGDMLSIANGDAVSVASGTLVMFDSDGVGGASAVQIGTLSGGGTSLTVTLNASANNAAIAALTEAIRFQTSDLTEVDRTVTFTLNDGDGTANGGHDFTRFDATVDVTAPVVNNAPGITAETLDNHVLANSSPNDPSARPADETVQLSNLGISGDAAVTVEFWFDYSGAVYAMPFGFDVYNLLVLDVSEANDDVRAIGFNVGSGGLYGVERSDLIGQWHHIAAVFDNGNVAQSRLYIDGIEQTLTPILFGGDNGWDYLSNSAHIGGWNADTQFGLDGQFDDVSIWHGARDAADIAADMNGTITGPQPGLVAAYTFENVSDGPGGVTDISGNGHHATLSTLTAAANVIVDPTLSHPQSVAEDQPLVFSGANHNAITVSDLDGDDLSVTLTVAHGAITLVAGSGPLVTGGADGTATVTISGSAAAINAALDGLSYHPNQNYHGADALMVTASDGQLDHAQTINLAINPVNDAPVVTGDMSVVAVTGGGEVALTVTDLGAVDPDTDPIHLTFTIDRLNHGRLTFGDERLQLGEDDTFTLADVQAGRVYYQSVGSYVGQDHITLSLSDDVEGAPTATAILGATVVNAQFRVLTTDGYDFDQINPVGAMGSGTIDPLSESDTTFRIVATDGRHFIVTGTGFEFQYEEDTNSDSVTLGTITSITELGPLAGGVRPELARFDLHVSAAAWYDGVVAAAAGDNSQMEALTSQWTFSFVGNAGADAFFAADVNDIFTGRAGNDTLGGEFGYDRANYGGATGPIDVQLADGIVTGDGSVGTDTLQSIELVTGSNFDDSFDATGFNSTSSNAGSTVTNNVFGMFNEFEGRGGADTITGNGQTRVSYYHATAGVVVTFNPETSWATATSGASGSATGDASVGTDYFTGVNHVRGTFFSDTFTGSSNPNQTVENFEGLGGDDLIDGGLGFDRAQYFQAADDAGIAVNLAAGIVTGGIDTGTDTLRSIEAIWGTNFADIYDATGFDGGSTNAGNAGNNGAASSFNEFEGGGGDDLVTGNNNTRAAFHHATGGVVVTLDPATNGAGTTGSGTAVGNDSVGDDTFVGGVTRVRGSEFNDVVSGNGAANFLEGQGGNDIIHGRGGGDTLAGGIGADIFVFESGSGVDTITDFNRNQGDRLDLRGYDFSSYGANTGFLFFTLNVSNPIGSGNTLITIGSDSILLQGVPSGEFGISDIIFGDTVAVSVQTPDGYDFSTVYGSLATGYADLAAGTFASSNSATHMFIVDAAHGVTFELTGTGLTYNGGYLPISGTIAEINILDTTNPADPAQLTQDHVLVNSNGWSVDAASLVGYLGQYNGPQTHADGLEGLDGIFGAATYSYVGSGGFAGNHSQPHVGADVFLGGDQADVFNGMPGPFGGMDPGSDTVDYSRAAAISGLTGITADLSNSGNNTGAAQGDTYISIENLRGTDFNDTLTGDGNNNVIEGGLGDDALDGGANGYGVDTASYEHATDGVSVSLAFQGAQPTGGAGSDTLTNFEGLRGSSFNDILTGNSNSVLEGGAGNDHLIGHAGQSGVTASYEHAGSGVTVDLSTPNPQNTGGAGTDTLTNIANLQGSQFNDTLIGDTHDNIFFGNGGDDVFVFNATTGHDTIGDFISGQDHIALDYAAFDASGQNDFSAWIAAGHATSIGSDVLIDLDLDAQNTILLRNFNLANLHANDFILPASVGG